MPLRKSKATKAKEAATEPVKNQVSDRTDDLMAALDAAKEALARASAVAGRKGAELPTSWARKPARPPTS